MLSLKSLSDFGKNKLSGIAKPGADADDDAAGARPVSHAKIVFTNKEYDDYESAKPHAINEIKDGDELWMYVKMPKPLKEYAWVQRFADKDGNAVENAEVDLVIGPRNGFGEFAKQGIILKGGEVGQYGMVYHKKMLTYLDIDYTKAAEFKLVLNKYLRGKSSFVVLKAVGGGDIGKWDNEIRLAGGDKKEVFAQGELMCNVEDGIAAYRKAWNAYSEILEKGDIADNKLPPSGRFNDKEIEKLITKQAAAEGIDADKVVFTTDAWESSTDEYERQTRHVYACLTYEEDGQCMYAMAEVSQRFVLGEWAPAQVSIYNTDTPYACGE
ncbi:MAG TPA: hypothetical protein PKC69_09090 [Chitinophagaceae bacterium]|nr:hypothetical protein [Chitinophagaceae bacterium]